MSRLALRGADAVLLPPEPGLPYLRHDRAPELRLEAGSLACRDGRIAALDDDAVGRARHRRPRLHPRCRASSTATRTCPSRAGGRRSTS